MPPKPMTNIDRALAHLNSALDLSCHCDERVLDELWFAKEELEAWCPQKQAAMEHKLIEIEQALVPVTEDDGTMRFVAGADIFDLIADAQALLDATEQEALHE